MNSLTLVRSSVLRNFSSSSYWIVGISRESRDGRDSHAPAMLSMLEVGLPAPFVR